MTPELQQQQRARAEQRMERIEEILKHICFEVDLAINGIRHLLVAHGHATKANDLGEQLELAHQERLDQREQRESANTLRPEDEKTQP